MRRLSLFILGLLPALGYATGIDQLRHFLASTKDARGSFVQTVAGKAGRKPQESSGLFAFSRPGKFRWSYEKPYQQLLVSNGEKFWTYDPDLKQVTIGKIGKAIGASPAALLAGDSLDKNFVLSDAGDVEGYEFVDAVPKDKDSSFERVRIGFSKGLPMILEVSDNFGQTTKLYLKQFEINASLPAETFTFTPPKGVDVIEQ
jgi:outer membrane lipoprotein carrier protein